MFGIPSNPQVIITWLLQCAVVEDMAVQGSTCIKDSALLFLVWLEMTTLAVLDHK